MAIKRSDTTIALKTTRNKICVEKSPLDPKWLHHHHFHRTLGCILPGRWRGCGVIRSGGRGGAWRWWAVTAAQEGAQGHLEVSRSVGAANIRRGSYDNSSQSVPTASSILARHCSPPWYLGQTDRQGQLFNYLITTYTRRNGWTLATQRIWRVQFMAWKTYKMTGHSDMSPVTCYYEIGDTSLPNTGFIEITRQLHVRYSTCNACAPPEGLLFFFFL